MSCRRKALAVAVAASTLAACGGSSKSHSASTSATVTTPVDASTPVAALKTYQNALADGDGAAACSVLTPAVQKRALAAAPQSGINAPDCKSLFSQIAGHLSPAQRKQIRKLQVSKLAIHGNTATVNVKGGKTATLSRTDGKWLLTNS